MITGYAKKICANPECGKEFKTLHHSQKYCCAACRNIMKKSPHFVIDAPRISKLDDMTPNELLFYGKIQAEKYIEKMKKKKEE